MLNGCVGLDFVLVWIPRLRPVDLDSARWIYHVIGISNTRDKMDFKSDSIATLALKSIYDDLELINWIPKRLRYFLGY